MKSGANTKDINEIKSMSEEGYDSEEISDALRIDESCVKSFMPSSVDDVEDDSEE